MDMHGQNIKINSNGKIISTLCINNLFIIRSQQCDVAGRNYSSLTNLLGDFKVNEMINCPGQSIAFDTAVFLGFCRGSASASRGFVSVEVGADNNQFLCESNVYVVDSGECIHTIGEQCDSLPHL